MDKNGNIKKSGIALAFVMWSAIVLSAFYITQHPLIFQVINGTTATLWSITLMFVFLASAAGLGYFTLDRTQLQFTGDEKIILGSGLGLGILGFAGYGLGAAGLANKFILALGLSIVLILVFIFKTHKLIWSDLLSLVRSISENNQDVPGWLPRMVLFTGLLGFLFSLLPPAEGFDGLFYHLRLPEHLLADGKILPYNILQFWFPSLIEGDFLLALGLGSERTAQLIHWSFSILTLILIWEWSSRAFGRKPAWWALAVLISMPSLPWISSWAYTDMALTFFGLACLYCIWRWTEENKGNWLVISGIFAGMAMGVKYTSFILPVLCILLILFYTHTLKSWIGSSIKFSIPAVLTALPWYLRNWLVMGNPFYPFVFGGRYWDSFQAAWYTGSGTGIGWDFREILLIPFTIMLGHRDQNYFDGRLGPLFLLLLPFALWIIWVKRSAAPRERSTIFIIGMFAFCTYIFWVFSVTQTIHLWQSRLLFPGLIPFAIVIGLAIANLDQLNSPQLRISFIANILICLVIGITALDNSLSLIVRRPIAYAFGMESRMAYFERIQPQYSEALKMINTIPNEAYVYFLGEPRSYTMTRKVQPDPIVNNLAHDFYLFGNAGKIVANWKSNGYTHILVFNPAIDDQFSKSFDQMLPYLQLIDTSKNYCLYLIKP